MYTKLITVETKQRFDIIQASENPFPLTSTVFILDTLQYWTHGVFLNGVTATEVSNDVTLNIAGSNYTFTKSDNVHKKNQDVDLGIHQETVGISTYNLSYVLKATDNHKLLQYIDRGGTDKAVYLSNQNDKLIIQSKENIVRTYSESNVTYNATILDTKNSSISLDGNQFKYKLGGDESSLYLARHDSGSTLPENNAAVKASRLGGSSTYGWIVMNSSENGKGNDYYAIKISNAASPVTYVKGGSYSTYVQLLSINDTFVPPATNVTAKNGAVPAPGVNSADYFLSSNGQWNRAIPAKVNDSYLYVDASGNLIWRDSSLVDTANSNVTSATISSLSLTRNWTNADNLTTRLDTNDGSYLLQITYGSQLYTGVFSYIKAGENTDDEIALHCSNATEANRGRLYAKIGSSGQALFLQVSATVDENNANLSIKYKKLL